MPLAAEGTRVLHPNSFIYRENALHSLFAGVVRWRQQFQIVDTDSLGQLVDGYHRRIAFAAFEATQILLAEARTRLNLLLRKTFRLPQPSEIFPNQCAHIHAPLRCGFRSAPLSTIICILARRGSSASFRGK